MAVAVVLIVALGNNNDKKKTASATTVRSEPISTANNDPFASAPVGTDKNIPAVQTSSPVQPVAGGHVGLYGGTLNHSTCDKHNRLFATKPRQSCGVGFSARHEKLQPTYRATSTG